MPTLSFEPTRIAGLYMVRSRPNCDERGRFRRLFDADEFENFAPNLRIVQTNLSTTISSGTVRGLHFQHAPASEFKLVACLRGRAYDVVVDLRPTSSTWLCWHAIELAAEEHLQVLIPPGCAHGFQALMDGTDLLYQHSARWSAELEGGVRHDDPALAIRWPLPVSSLSLRDRSFPSIDTAFSGVRI